MLVYEAAGAPGAVVIRPDDAPFDELDDALAKLREKGRSAFVVDLRGSGDVAPSIVGVLISLLADVQESGGVLAVVAEKDRVPAVFERFGDVDAALAWVWTRIP
jgi:anti-anti-sigma regulatory factor